MEIVILILAILVLFIFISKKGKKKNKVFINYQEQKLELSEKEKENIRQKLILSTEFKTVPIMNKSEFNIFRLLTELLNDDNHKEKKFRIFTQVGLGGVINTKTDYKVASQDEKDAFWAVNSLRADFIIVDSLGYPVVLIEYNGKGHNIENPAYRDIRKQYACQQVSLPIVAFYYKDDKNMEKEENNRKLEEVSKILFSHNIKK